MKVKNVFLFVSIFLFVITGCKSEIQEIVPSITLSNITNNTVVNSSELKLEIVLDNYKEFDGNFRVRLNDAVVANFPPTNRYILGVVLDRYSNVIVISGEKEGRIITSYTNIVFYISETKKQKIVYKPVKSKKVKKYSEILLEEIKPTEKKEEFIEVKETQYISDVVLELFPEKSVNNYYKDSLSFSYRVEFAENVTNYISYFSNVLVLIENQEGKSLFSKVYNIPGSTIDIDLPPLSSGDYLLILRAFDVKGKMFETGKWFSVDKTPPNISFVDVTNGQYVRSFFTFSVKIDDYGSGVKDVTALFAGKEISFIKKEDKYVFSIETKQYTNGKYSIELEVSDALGNKSKSKIFVVLDNWFEEIVDYGPGKGMYVSSFVDGEGNVYVAYYDSSKKNLKFAFKKSEAGKWTNMVVDSSVDSGKYSSIFVDSYGRIHISYTYINEKWDDEDLRYAVFDGEWKIQTLDQNDKAGRYTSISVDQKGVPHISYYNYTVGNLRYITYNIQRDRWEPFAPDSFENVGTDTSIDIYNDTVYITYLDNANGNLKMCWKGIEESDIKWRFETIDSEGKVGYYGKMKIDSKGNIHVAYYDSTKKALKYGIKKGDKWYFTVIDTKDDPGRFVSIFVDNQDKPHISYFVESKKEIRYAYFDGKKWNIEPVFSGKSGSFSSVYVLNGKPHILVNDLDEGLKLLRK